MSLEIGSLEHDLHTVFAENCIPSDNTVYSPNERVFEALDEYCAEAAFHEARKPLILMGPPGCGKSAALANWLETRKQAKNSNKSRLTSLNPKPEFIFYHVVGCSRQSTFVGHMLNRLMSELKDYFEITREVSEGEDALSWDFPPFLELAVQKGKVLLVIDGVQRLRSDDGEAKLNWLPLRFPPNVRVVLSATDTITVHDTPNSPQMSVLFDEEDETSSKGSGGQSPFRLKRGSVKGSSQLSFRVFSEGTDSESDAEADRSGLEQMRCDRVLRELIRRDWHMLKMYSGMNIESTIDVIKKFLANSSSLSADVQRPGSGGDSVITNSSVGSSFFRLTESGGAAADGGVSNQDEEEESLSTQEQLKQIDEKIFESSGMTLFPSQVETLKKLGGGNPLFLSVALRCLRWSLANGYSSSKIIEEYSQCRNNILNLYGKILDTWERGQESPGYSEREQHLAWAKEQGGVPGLRQTHPLYQSFVTKQDLKIEEEMERLRIDSNNSQAPSRCSSAIPVSNTRPYGVVALDEDFSSIESTVQFKDKNESKSVESNDGSRNSLQKKASEALEKKRSKKKEKKVKKIQKEKKAPPKAVIAVGSRVEALYGGGEDWYPGEVAVVNENGSYFVKYDDGDEEDGVTSDMIRLEGRGDLSPEEEEYEEEYEEEEDNSEEEEEEDDSDGYSDDSYNDDFEKSQKEIEAEEEEKRKREELEAQQLQDEEEEERKRKEEEEKEEEERKRKEEEKEDEDDDGYGDDFEDADDYGDDFDDDEEESTPDSPKSPKSPKSSVGSPVQGRFLMKKSKSISEEDLRKIRDASEAKREAEERKQAELAAIKAEQDKEKLARLEKEKEEKEARLKVEIEETLDKLPLEHKGGKAVVGFQATLGYALALLLVARHGLREHELWAMLGDLGHEDELSQKRGVSAEEAAEESLFKLIMDNKAKLMRIYRNMDLNHNGCITMHEFRRGIRRLDVGVNDMQLEKIVSVVVHATRGDNSTNGGTAVSSRRTVGGGFTYAELFNIFENRIQEIGDIRRFKKSASSDQQEFEEKAAAMGSTESALDAILNDIGGSESLEGNVGEDRTIGQENETALLHVLVALGVMRYKPAKVLVLPMQCEALREVIFFRYIGSHQALDAWHGRIAKFFARHTPTMRRCEELPWHLERVRKWPSLMNVLSDLKTFELMSGHKTLKPELLEYWRKLTLGPLFLSDRMEWEFFKNSRIASDKLKTGDGKQGPHDVILPYEASVCLAELDKQYALGLTDAQSRKHRLDGQIATYDIVAEHNRMVEAWQASARPSTKRLAQVLYRIGSFLVDFSEKVESTLRSQERLLPDSIHPPFMRKPLTIQGNTVADAGLEVIGIYPYMFDVPSEFGGVESKAAAIKAANRKKKNSVGFDNASSTAGGTQAATVYHNNNPSSTMMNNTSNNAIVLKTGNNANGSNNHNNGMSSNHQNSNLNNSDRKKEFVISQHYYYDRWLWMQFPWIALTNATAASQKARGEGLLEQTGQASPLPVIGKKNQSLSRAHDLIRASSAGATMQAGGRVDNDANEGNKEGMAATSGGGGPIDAFMLGETGSIFVDAGENDQALLAALDGSKGTERRWYNTKKINPVSNQAPRPAVHLSEAQKSSRVSAALGSTYIVRDIDFSHQKISKLEQTAYIQNFDENGAKIKAMPSRMKPDPILTAWVPSMQECEQKSKEGGGGGASSVPGIPFSYSSAKAQRAGTRFPSVEKLHIDRLLEKEKNQDKFAANAIGRFGGSYTPRTIKGVIELKHMDELQANAPNGVDMGYLPAHTSMFAVPINETKKADSLARVVKLRHAYDQALGHRQRKVALLESMKTKVKERQAQDDHLADTCAIGERTMAALELRVRRMQIELKASEALGDFYEKIVHQASELKNPACEKIRLEEMEQQVKLSKIQVKDLLLTRQKVYAEKEKIEKVQINEVKKQRRTCAGLRAALKRRMMDVVKSTEQLKADRAAYLQNSNMNSPDLRTNSSILTNAKNSNGTNNNNANTSQHLSRPPTNVADVSPSVTSGGNQTTSMVSQTSVEKELTGNSLSEVPTNNGNSAVSLADHDFTSKPKKKKNQTQDSIEEEQPRLKTALGMLRFREREKQEEKQRLAMERVIKTESAFGCKFNVSEPLVFDEQVLDKIRQGELLNESLTEQQANLEARLIELKEEHEAAQKSLETLRISAPENTTNKQHSKRNRKDKLSFNNTSSVSGQVASGPGGLAREHRRLEEEYSRAEIKCHQIFRKLQKACETIENVRSGVQHLGEIIIAFDKADVLPPRAPLTNASSFVLDREAIQRSFNDNSVLHEILASAEQHVIAVKDELSVGAQMGESGLYQMEGAAGAHARKLPKKDPLEHLNRSMSSGGSNSRTGRPSGKEHSLQGNHTPSKKFKVGKGSKSIKKLGKGAAAEFLVTDQEVSEMAKIRVMTKRDTIDQIEQDIIDRRHQQDAIAEKRDKKMPVRKVGPVKAGVKVFLNESLVDKTTLDEQRKANNLAGHSQGATAPKGLALDDVLIQSNPHQRRVSKDAAPVGAADAQEVVDREALKKSSNGLVARKKASERRVARMKEAEERRLLEDANAM